MCHASHSFPSFIAAAAPPPPFFPFLLSSSFYCPPPFPSPKPSHIIILTVLQIRGLFFFTNCFSMHICMYTHLDIPNYNCSVCIMDLYVCFQAAWHWTSSWCFLPREDHLSVPSFLHLPRVCYVGLKPHGLFSSSFVCYWCHPCSAHVWMVMWVRLCGGVASDVTKR